MKLFTIIDFDKLKNKNKLYLMDNRVFYDDDFKMHFISHSFMSNIFNINFNNFFYKLQKKDNSNSVEMGIFDDITNGELLSYVSIDNSTLIYINYEI